MLGALNHTVVTNVTVLDYACIDYAHAVVSGAGACLLAPFGNVVSDYLADCGCEFLVTLILDHKISLKYL